MKKQLTIFVIGLAVVFTILLMRTDKVRGDLQGEIDNLEQVNSSLEADISEREIIIREKRASILHARDSITAAENELLTLKARYADLEKDYDNLKTDISHIPVDSSYKFLTTHAYPFAGKLEYQFNAPQVQAIHLTYLEKQELRSMNTNLLHQTQNYSSQLDQHKHIIGEQSGIISQMESTTGDLRQINYNNEKVIVNQAGIISRERKGKNLWKGTAVVAVVIATLIAI